MCGDNVQTRKSEKMRKHVLEATVEEILLEGIHHATILNIAKRANVSRGAVLYHYPTRDELMHAALEKVLTEEVASLKELTEKAREGEISIDQLFDHIWEHFSGPMFMVALEYLTAARVNDNIKDVLIPLARNFNSSIEELWGAIVPDPVMREVTLHSTLCMMRGMSLQSIWRNDSSFNSRLLEFWKEEFKSSILKQYKEH